MSLKSTHRTECNPPLFVALAPHTNGKTRAPSPGAASSAARSCPGSIPLGPGVIQTMLSKTLVPLLLVGCSTGILGSGDPATQPTTQSGASGAKLTVSLGTDTDVVGFHFEVE